MKNFPLLLLTLSIASSISSHAASFYLTVDMPFGANWNSTPLSTYWNSARDGSGSAPALLAGNDFLTNNHILRTSASTFAGATLTLEGGAQDKLFLKNGLNNTATVGSFSSVGGGSIEQADAVANSNLSVTSYSNSGTGTKLTATAGRGMTLSVGTLTGSGNFSLQSTGTVRLSLSSAAGYTGSITFAAAGTLDFENSLTTGGGLTISNGGKVQLDQNVAFSSLTINGSPQGAGTYSYSSLNSTYPTIFLAGGSGSITVVPEPAAALLLGFGLLLLHLRRQRVSQ